MIIYPKVLTVDIDDRSISFIHDGERFYRRSLNLAGLLKECLEKGWRIKDKDEQDK